jgi:hypothetical protein
MLPLPVPISPLPFTPGTGPTYTQIFEDTMGVAGTKDDGYDSAAAELAGISNAFGAELNSDPLGGSLGAAGIVLGGVNPATLDLHMSNYVATQEYGMGIVAAAAGAVEPQLLTLPLTPGDGSTQFIPPKQLTHDFGTVQLNSPVQGYFVGKETDTPTGQILGILTKGFVIAAPGIFSEASVETDTLQGFVHINWSIQMTPTRVGQWTAQYEYVDESIRQLVILTLTVNVTP